MLAELDAWDRVCLAGYHEPWLRAARRLARAHGAPLFTSMGHTAVVGLRMRGWTRRETARPGGRRRPPRVRTGRLASVRGDLAQLPHRFAGVTVVDADVLRVSPRAAAARCTCGPSTTRPSWRGCSTAAPTGSSPTAPTCCATCSAPATGRRAAAVSDASPATRGQVLAWGLWDWGSAAYNTVILTFVFSVYLTDTVGDDLPGGVSANSWLAWSIGLAGLVLALLAPVLGARADAAGRRRRAVGVWTAATVATMAGLVAVRDDHRYLALGLVLLGLGSIFFELASVSYNAVLRQVSTPATMGRVSGFGWAMGYFGGIVLLLGVYLGFIAGDGPLRGLLQVPAADGWNIRLVALVAAAWFAVFAVPMLVAVPETPPSPDRRPAAGVAASYRALLHDLRVLYRADRHTVWFLGASAPCSATGWRRCSPSARCWR